jgi:hypothetical protein
MPLTDSISYENIPKNRAILINGWIYDVEKLYEYIFANPLNTRDPRNRDTSISEEAKKHIDVLHKLTDEETESTLIDITEKQGIDLSFVTTTKQYYTLPVVYKIKILSNKSTNKSTIKEEDYTSDTPIYKALTSKTNSSKTIINILKEHNIQDIYKIYIIPSSKA